MERELVIRNTLNQLGKNVQDLFSCCPETGREAEDKLGFSVEYNPDTLPGSSDHTQSSAGDNL